MTMRTMLAGVGLLAAAALAGCGSSVKLDETPVETRTPTPAARTAAQGAAAPGANAGGARPQSQVATVDLGRTPAPTARADASLGRVVYFDFDSYVIKDEYRPLVDGHAKALTADRSRHMVLKSMQLLGVADNQLEAVSYGKERPVAEGHDEAAWAKNRRVELKDK